MQLEDYPIIKQFQCGPQSYWIRTTELSYLKNDHFGHFLELNPKKYRPKLFRRLNHFQGQATYFFREHNDTRLLDILADAPDNTVKALFFTFIDSSYRESNQHVIDAVGEYWPNIKIIHDGFLTHYGDVEYHQTNLHNYIRDKKLGEYLELQSTTSPNLQKKTLEKFAGKAAILFNKENHPELLLNCIKTLKPTELYLFYENHKDIKASLPLIRKIQEALPEISFKTDYDSGVLVGWSLGKPILPPSRVTIEIYNDCNLKCDFCWTHSPLAKRKGDKEWMQKWRRQKLSLETVKEYIDELDKNYIRQVELCAVGDPLFHPEVWEMIKHIKARNLRLQISTNGTLINKKQGKLLLDLGVERLVMNISAGDRDNYALVHNVDAKIFDCLEQNLVHLYELSKTNGYKKPYMESVNVMTSKNVRYIENIIDFSLRFGADCIHFRHVWVHNDFLENLSLTPEDISYLLRNRRRYARKLDASGVKHNLEEFYTPLEKHRLRNKIRNYFSKARSKVMIRKKNTGEHSESFHRHPPCTISYHFSLLDIDNKLRYCCRGNQVHDDYNSITHQWNNERYNNFRKYWREAYVKNDSLCRGCPHIEENQLYWEKIKDAKLDRLQLK